MDSPQTPLPDLPLSRQEVTPAPFEDTASATSLMSEVADTAIPVALLPESAITEPLTDGPWIENPAWSGLDLLIVVSVLFFGIVLFSAIFMGVLRAMPQYHGKSIEDITRTVSVWLVIPAESAAYAVTFIVLYLLASTRRMRFWPALSWHWPRGFQWAGFLLAGSGLAFVGGFLDKVLPMPKSAPIEQMFLQPGAPQLLAFFGVAIAPFVEETLFRGLLYPVSNRWLRNVLNSQQRIRRGRLIFLLLVPWGFAAHALPATGAVLLVSTVLLLTGTLFAILSAKRSPAAAARVILPGLTFFTWGLAASHLTRPLLVRASLALLFMVFLMTVFGLKLKPGAATRLGVAFSFLLTAGSFALLHSEQLGNSWGPVLVLFLVSSVLTFTRAYTKSLASSFLVHFAYNSTLFGGMYFATDHFRHLEHMPH